MKIKGAAPGRNTADVTLGRPGGKSVTLTVSALPLGYWDDVEQWIPEPRPPQSGFVRDTDRALAKDAQGRPVAEYDRDDPKYLAACKRATILQNALCIAEALQNEPKVTFDAKPSRNRMEKYAEALIDEMKEFGLSDGDQVAILRAVGTASSISFTRLAEEREGFLSGTSETAAQPTDTSD